MYTRIHRNILVCAHTYAHTRKTLRFCYSHTLLVPVAPCHQGNAPFTRAIIIIIQSQLERECQMQWTFIRVDLKVCMCKCVSVYSEWITFRTFTCEGLHEARVKGEIKALSGFTLASLTWVGSEVNTLENGIFTHTHTHTHSVHTSLFSLAFLLPEIAEITGTQCLLHLSIVG